MTENDKEINVKDLAIRAKILSNSYMSKEEFINIISTIDFKFIKEADLELVTDIVINPEENRVETRSKTIRID